MDLKTNLIKDERESSSNGDDVEGDDGEKYSIIEFR